MKKKIMTTAITALMLISLISVFQAGAASAQEDPAVELKATGDGIAEWTTAEQYSGGYSITFNLPNGETKGNNAEAEIPLSEPVQVGSVSDWTYWAKGEGITPAMKFYIDTTGDGGADVMVLAQVYIFKSSELPSDWSPISRSDYDGPVSIFPWYMAYNLIQGGEWSERPYGGKWDDVINGYGTYPGFGEYDLVKVAIGYTDLRGGPTSAIAYIDNITISGETYDLEMPETRPLTVDDDRAENSDAYFQTIQGAIDAASPNETVLVYPGTYTEDVNVGVKGITIKGENLDAIVDGGFIVTADNVTIDGLTIQNGCLVFGDLYAGIHAGYWNANSNFNIINNEIVGPETKESGYKYVGINLQDCGASGTIDNNKIHDWLTGIYIGTIGYGHTITNNEIYQNTVYGIGWYNEDDTVIKFNDIHHNRIGVVGCGGTGNVINFNNIEKNTEYGIDSWYGQYGTEVGVIIDATLNWWGDPSGPSGVGLGSGDAVSANVNYRPWLDDPYQIGEARYFNVLNENTKEEFDTIQSAIDVASPGDTVLVGPGTYNESAQSWVDIDIYKPLSLIGAGPSQTIVELRNGVMDGVIIDASDVLIQGIKFTKEPEEPYASGFNIRSGGSYDNITLRDIESEYSQGMNICFDGSTFSNITLENCNIHHGGERNFYEAPDTTINGLTVTNCHFDDGGQNPTCQEGGPGDPIGFNIQGTTTGLTITGGTFNNNPNGGLGFERTTDAIIRDVVVENSGTASWDRAGIGIWDERGGTSNVQIINPTVTNCGGRGIMFGTWDKTVTNISVTGGTVSGAGNNGIMLYAGGDGGLVTDITVDDVTVTGSGQNNFIVMGDSNGVCSDITIDYNDISDSDGILVQSVESITILNNTISDFNKFGIVAKDVGSVTIENNTIITADYSEAPNGIQIGYLDKDGNPASTSTTGTVDNNQISGCHWENYDPETQTYEDEYTGSGILIIDTESQLTISGNEVRSCDVGLDIESGAPTTITNNDVHNNSYGFVLWNANPTINYNNIYRNGLCGVYRTIDLTGTLDATYNYWGHPSGPGRNKGRGRGKGPGLGDRVSKNVRYQPWLTKYFQTVLEKHVGHYGFEGAHLKEGWNTLSVPIYLDNDAWEEMSDYLDENIAYRFNASAQKWELMTAGDKLDPLDAIYIRMNSEGIVPLAVSASRRCPPEKELKKGWNLVGLAVWENENMPVNQALVSVELTPDGNRGYTNVVSPSLNRESWTYTIVQTDKPLMHKNECYWVYMVNPGNLAGFSNTPLKFLEP